MANAVQGLNRYLARLKQVPDKVKSAIDVQLLANAKELASAMRSAVSVDQGVLRGSIRVEPGSKPLSIRVAAGGKLTTKRVVGGRKWYAIGGGGYAYDYALAVEYGHRIRSGKGTRGAGHVPARPFFWPSYRARKKLMKRRLAGAARKAIAAL